MDINTLKNFLKQLRMSNKGVDGMKLTFEIVGIAVALLVLGQLASGPNSFFYNLVSANNTGGNATTQLLIGTIFPILIVLAIVGFLVVKLTGKGR